MKNKIIEIVNLDTPVKTLTGFVAMNKNDYDIENMTFYKTKQSAIDFWGKRQQITKVTVKFYL